MDDERNDTLRGRDMAGLGGLVVGSVVAGLVIGLLADDWAATSPTFTLVGIAAGIVGGVVASWLRIRTFL